MSVMRKRERTPDMLGDRGKNLKLVSATEELDRYMDNTSLIHFSADTIVDLIANKGADPNHQRVSDGQTPLMWLSTMGENETHGRLYDEVMKGFRYLLRIPSIDVNLVDKSGDALIHKTAFMESSVFLSMLLRREASKKHINMLGRYGMSPLHITCSLGFVSIPIIGILLEKGANPYLISRIQGYTPLFNVLETYAVMDGDLDRLNHKLDVFLEYGVDIAQLHSRDGENIMHMVAGYVDDARFCTKVLNRGGGKVLSERDHYGRTPLKKAHLFNKDNVVLAIEIFMERGRL